MTEPAPQQPALEVWETAYVIEFTDQERMLLTTTDDNLLTHLEQQERFLLRMALRPEQCPACKFVLCPRSAWAGAEPYSLGTAPDEGYACPACKAVLIHRQGLTVTEHWMELAPGQDVHIFGPGAM